MNSQVDDPYCTSIYHWQLQRDNSIDLGGLPVLRDPTSYTWAPFVLLIGQMVSQRADGERSMVDASTEGTQARSVVGAFRLLRQHRTCTPRDVSNEEDGTEGRKQFTGFGKKGKHQLLVAASLIMIQACSKWLVRDCWPQSAALVLVHTYLAAPKQTTWATCSLLLLLNRFKAFHVRETSASL